MRFEAPWLEYTYWGQFVTETAQQEGRYSAE